MGKVGRATVSVEEGVAAWRGIHPWESLLLTPSLPSTSLTTVSTAYFYPVLTKKKLVVWPKQR
jgi:hypothetical protein